MNKVLLICYRTSAYDFIHPHYHKILIAKERGEPVDMVINNIKKGNISRYY